MGVELEWQKEVGEESWPRSGQSGPSSGGSPGWLRWLLLGLAAVVVGAGLAFWQLSNQGLSAAKTDVQRALEFGHWALQQKDQEVFEQHLDRAYPPWRTQVMAEWPYLSAAAQEASPPVVERIRLLDDLAETTVRWQDAVTGQSYLTRRWFRLAEGEWRWTHPRDERWGNQRTANRPHLTLAYYGQDADLVAPILDNLEDFTASLCARYGVSGSGCRFNLRWDLLRDSGLPIPRRDPSLPPLASAVSDEADGVLYLLNVDEAARRSQSLRQQLRRFHPGDAYVAQTEFEVLRPADAAGLPDSLMGEPGRPLVLPTPWLWGVTDDGQPHPRWQAQAQRALADLVLRRSYGVVVGSARYVNAAWALHQALLAIDYGLPELAQLALPGPAAPIVAAPVGMPDLSSLGAALQAEPDELALAQLADLARYLQAHWSADELLALAGAMGSSAFVDTLLADTLGVDEAAFLRDWRAEQLAQPGSPLASLTDTLKTQMLAEAEAERRNDRAALFRLFDEEGRRWLVSIEENLLPSQTPIDAPWNADILAAGAIEEVIWVELEEQDGERQLTDLRFYRWDEWKGWQRTAPDERFWGEARTLTTGLVTWRYRQLDEEAVLAVASEIDSQARQMQADLGLPLEPITIAVTANTEQAWRFDESDALELASPRRLFLDNSDSDPAAALRSNAIAQLALQLAMQRGLQATSNEGPGDGTVLWIMGASRSEIRQRSVPEPLLPPWYTSWHEDLGRLLAEALQADNLPDLTTVLAESDPPPRSVAGSAQLYLILYLGDVHGGRWLSRIFDVGLQTAVAEAAAERGWSVEDQFETDWRAYLRDLLEVGA